jgi:hypothetical protein
VRDAGMGISRSSYISWHFALERRLDHWGFLLKGSAPEAPLPLSTGPRSISLTSTRPDQFSSKPPPSMSPKATHILRLIMASTPKRSVSTTMKSSASSSLRKQKSAAAATVLSIFELLEQILLSLSMFDLLRAGSVCVRWHSIIKASPRIQRALYFLPKEVPLKPTNADFKPNPVLAAAFADNFEFSRPMGLYHIWQRDSKAPKAFCTEILLHNTMDSWRECVKYKHASWRRMLMTQPPVVNVTVLDLRVAPDYDDCFVEWADDMAGVRMGHILELDDAYIDAR